MHPDSHEPYRVVMREVWIWALAGGGVVVLFVMALLVPGDFGRRPWGCRRSPGP